MPPPKILRWIDLLAALLSHHSPLTFAELAQYVPAYLTDGSVALGVPSDTLKRMFERDKLELRTQGIPIEMVSEEGSAESAYVLKKRDFYLPYLAVASSRGTQKPPVVDRYGYRSLEFLTFEPDELEAIVDGARRASSVGHPTLSNDVRNALRKLAFDLPLGAIDGEAAPVVVAGAARANPDTLSTLGDALYRRKTVSFEYQSMGAPAPQQRHTEPYGLFFINGHWYIAARDIEKNACRNFRVSRMSAVRVNASQPLTSDYEIPETFSLAAHARSKPAWDIGDNDACQAVVNFRGQGGAVRAAAAMGRADETSASLRHFTVRRIDSFARWLLAFAGEAVPVSPAALVDEFAGLVAATQSVYAS
jgi:predicted DNA-binding transcriptional regulator YafY